MLVERNLIPMPYNKGIIIILTIYSVVIHNPSV